MMRVLLTYSILMVRFQFGENQIWDYYKIMCDQQLNIKGVYNGMDLFFILWSRKAIIH